MHTVMQSPNYAMYIIVQVSHFFSRKEYNIYYFWTSPTTSYHWNYSFLNICMAIIVIDSLERSASLKDDPCIAISYF